MASNTTVAMETISRGETYPAETITLGFDITGCKLYRVLENAASGVEVKSWDSDTVGEITITDAANGVYNVPKWLVNLIGSRFTGKDKIQYANGDKEDLWNLTLTVED